MHLFPVSLVASLSGNSNFHLITSNLLEKNLPVFDAYSDENKEIGQKKQSRDKLRFNNVNQANPPVAE